MLKKNENEIANLIGGYDCTTENNVAFAAGAVLVGGLLGGPIGVFAGLYVSAWASTLSCSQYLTT